MAKTRKELFEMVLATVNSVEHPDKDEMIKFIEHQLEMVANRNSKSKSASDKRQAENKALADKLFELMVELDSPMTATQLFKACDLPEVASTQKMVSLLNLLQTDGKVVRTTEKKTAFFSVNKGE